MSVAAMTIVQTVIIERLCYVGPQTRRMPLWLRNVIFHRVADCFRTHRVQQRENNGIDEFGVSKGASMTETGTGNTLIMESDLVDFPKDASANCANDADGSPHTETATRSLTKQLEGIIADLKRQRDKPPRHENNQIKIQEEWNHLALLLDKLFFTIYMVVTAVATISILVYMPTTGDWFKSE